MSLVSAPTHAVVIAAFVFAEYTISVPPTVTVSNPRSPESSTNLEQTPAGTPALVQTKPSSSTPAMVTWPPQRLKISFEALRR